MVHDPSEGHVLLHLFRAQAYRLLNSGQVLHQEYPLSRRFSSGHGVLQDLRILGELGELYGVALQVLCQVVIEAVPLQDFEGVVSIGYGLELEAIGVLVVIGQQCFEDLLVLEKMLEEPELADLEDDDAFARSFRSKVLGLISCLIFRVLC